MSITKGKIGNALTSTASDHVVATANDIFDEALELYQDVINQKVKDIEDSIGKFDGIAQLNESGKVPSSQLPSYVDDVIEVGSFDLLPTIGETGKIYVTLDTNLTYRWSGQQYSEISQSLALGENSSTAFPGDRGLALEQDKADKTELEDYVKKINNPFTVGTGLQSARQKNPDYPNTASGNASSALGANNESTKTGSFTANRNNHAIGDDSNATGYGNTASGDTSHAEGHYTTASGKYSHSEGHGTKATNDASHAEGWNSQAPGDTSHAEGHETIAGGARSHTEGKYTQTFNDSEHAEGFYNKSFTSDVEFYKDFTTLHSVGIGTSNEDRKNAFEITKNGNVYVNGIGGYDGTNAAQEGESFSLQQMITDLRYDTRYDQLVADHNRAEDDHIQAVADHENVEGLSKVVANNALSFDFDSDTGIVYVVLGADNTNFNEAEIDDETGEVIVTYNI